MCQVLQVSHSGYYIWKKRPASRRWIRQAAAVSKIKRIHAKRHKDTYANPRIHQELVSRGYEVCETTVAKLLQREGLLASTVVGFRACNTDSNHLLPVEENAVNREFDRNQINEVWVSDLTYIPTKANACRGCNFGESFA